MQLALSPLKLVFDAIVTACFNVANHKFGLNEELEEHLWLLHHSASYAVCTLFASLSRPLLFLTCHELFMQKFPTAHVLVCMREPTASIPSYIDLVMNQGKRSFADKRYVKFLQNDLYLYSKKMYEGLLRMAQDSSSLRKRMHFIAFRYT